MSQRDFNSFIHKGNRSRAAICASSNVLPKVTHPGNAGNDTLYPPSIAGSNTANDVIVFLFKFFIYVYTITQNSLKTKFFVV